MLVPLPLGLDIMIWCFAILIMLFCWQFSTLTIADTGTGLKVWFGRLPIFKTSITYASITGFRTEKTTWLDGWGLHYGRGGWLFNLWGFDCVRISTELRMLRLGTDDLNGLCELLEIRTGIAPASDGITK